MTDNIENTGSDLYYEKDAAILIRAHIILKAIL